MNKKGWPIFLRVILELLVVSVVVIAAYFIYSFIDARRETQQYCSQLTAGTSVETAKNMASDRYMRFTSDKSPDAQGVYTAYVYGYGISGIFICTVEHNGKTVIKAKMR